MTRPFQWLQQWFHRDDWPAGLIVLSFVLLGIWFAQVIPPFETPDEHYHYAFARHLAQGKGLPVQASTPTGPWQQQGSQAPLYYWLVGRLTAGIDQADFERIAVLNPRANLGDPLYPGNKNRMLYSAVQRPLTGANLALHVGRWFSVLLGCVTLGSLYATARLLWPRPSRLPLLALATAAWLPQFVFLSASFTNDTLVIALSALTLYRLAYLVHRYGALPQERAAAPPIPWWEWAVVGVLLGAAALSKLQGLGLWLLAALAGCLIAWRRGDWRVLLRAALPVALPALAIAGWWYWRNIALYGDWTGLSYLAAITGDRTSPLTWDGWWQEFRGLRYSSWGLFGWFSLLLPLWVYTVLDVAALVAIGGGLGTLWTRLRGNLPGMLEPGGGRIRAILWLWSLISGGALLYWIIRAEGSQGRLLFPALTALIILLIAGWDAAWRGILRRVSALRENGVLGLQALLPLFLLGCSLYAGLWLLPRAYAAPAPVAEIPAQATPVDFRYGEHGALHMLAMEVAPGMYQPGDSVHVTLYMKADEDAEIQNQNPHAGESFSVTRTSNLQDYQLFIQLLDDTGTEVGNLTTHPGWGRNPTSLWQPGAIYADTYPVRVSRAIDSRSPLLARIYVGFVNPATENAGNFPIVAVNAEGEVVDPTIAGHVVLHPRHLPDAEGLDLEPMDVRFGEVIELRGAGAVIRGTSAGAVEERGLQLELLWEAVGVPDADLTAFVHVLDRDGEWQTGYDAAPSPRFPTRHWQTGDRIHTSWQVELPPDLDVDDVEIWVGLYPAQELGAIRTPITHDGGAQVQHDMVRIEARVER